MDKYIIEVLIVLLIGVVIRLYMYSTKLKRLIKSKDRLESVIDNNSAKQRGLKDEIRDLEDKIGFLTHENTIIKQYVNVFIHGRLKVYVRSNFHNNYSTYNGKYYAKINAGSNSKAEGIPVLSIPDNKYTVIDIYKLKSLMREHPDSDISTILELAKTPKESLIQELGNKVLTSYHR